MAVPSTAADLSTTAASNSPAGSESIGTSLDDYMRAFQAILKQENSKGTDIASASTIDVPSAGKYFVVTGTTGIATISDDWTGRTVYLKFSDAVVLTHSAGLILPGAANITTAAGDVFGFNNESTGVWRCVFYTPATGYQPKDATLTSLAGLTLSQGCLLTATGADAGSVLAKGTASQQLRMNAGATAPEWFTPATSGITLGTPTASTSGTSIDFTGIPSGTKRITVNFSAVSTSGSSPLIVQLGDAGGIEATSYVSEGQAGAGVASSTAGFVCDRTTAAAALRYGSLTLNLESAAAFRWCAMGIIYNTTAPEVLVTTGTKALSAELTQVRITTAGGTETFDAGEINISYE